MPVANGYVQLVVKGGDTFAAIHPPVDGGAPLKVNDLTAYLDKNMLNQYDLKALNEACANRGENTIEVRVGIAPFRPFNEIMEMDISADKMLVFCKFYPASAGGDLMDENEIVQQLEQAKIKFGIDHEAIRKYLANREFCKDLVLAKGKPAKHGTDAKINYFFNTSLNTKPKKNEDGSVNYHDLNTVSMVTKGQKLAELIPPVLGEDGLNVLGEVIKQRQLKDLKLQHGANITMSEDGLSIFSEVTGHATLTQGQVFVSDILEIPADVDTSTGDIDYDGSVLIKGNVKSGFKVKAKGDIVVEGVVEGAIVVSTEGQIVIKQGIHGMNKGVLDAHGNILCKFIESAKIISGGYVETEGIMHSQVSAFSDIIVHGKKGLVAGGTLRAGNLVETETLGSEMGAATTVEVGVDPKKKQELNALQEALKEKAKEAEKIRPILTTFSEKLKQGVQLPADKVLYVQKLAASFKTLQGEIAELSSQYEMLKREVQAGSDARVKVTKDCFQGVTIIISDVSLTTKDKRSYCMFVREAGEVTVKNL